MPPKKSSNIPAGSKLIGEISVKDQTQQIWLLRESQDKTRWRPTYKPPTFSGTLEECPAAFLLKIESNFDAEEDSDSEMIDAAVGQFTGSAASWWLLNKNLSHTWTSFKEKLSQEFDGPATRGQIAKQLFTNAQLANESGQAFVSRQLGLWKRLPSAFPDVKDRVEQMIQQLQPAHHNYVRSLGLTTAEELMEKLSEIDKMVQLPTTSKPRRFIKAEPSEN